MKLVILTTLVAVAAAGFSPGDFMKNMRSLQGASFISRIAKQCKQPIEQFGYCFVGKDEDGYDVEPASGLGRAFIRRGVRAMEKIRKDPEIQILEDMGTQVEACFADNQCLLNPVEAVKCFLDFVINGGPYARVAECLHSSWGVSDLDTSPPKFGDLTAVEKDMKLFAGIGLYKRLHQNVTKFWEKYERQVSNMCLDDSRTAAVKSCINNVVGYPTNNPMALDTQKALEGSSNMADTSELAQRLSIFGDPYDVKTFLSLVQYRIVGCGLDFFGPGTSAVRAMKGADMCKVPACLQYVWTIKDGLCNECRTSLSIDGKDAFVDVIPFLRSAADEFVSVVSQSDYRCQSECVGCRAAAGTWKAQGTNVLQGFGGEALVVTKLLQDVCAMGAEAPKLQDGVCDY